ncbi:acid phosphatase precursor [Naviculisporaceae sp. PSN 640]
MRVSEILAGSALALAGLSTGLNILMNNDDGFGSANLRELYKMLKADGHDVFIVAPVNQQSSQGGRSVFTDEPLLVSNSIYDIVPAGSPSIGPDPNDSHIWYYNGTPAACTFMALDYVLPNFANFSVPDLVVTGPNYGTNLGPFVWTLSGTAGAAYAATGRGLPAIAISGSNGAEPYYNVLNSSHPAYQVASVAHRVVKGVIESAKKMDKPKNTPLLPLGYGLNVNIPPVDLSNYTDVPVIHTRMTGSAETNEAVPNPDKPGTFTWANIRPLAPGVNRCVNGDCGLTGETKAVNELGSVSLSIYVVDYTAPNTVDSRKLVQMLAKGKVIPVDDSKAYFGEHAKRFTA